MKWFNNLAKEMQDNINNTLLSIGEEAGQDLSHLKLKDEVLQFPEPIQDNESLYSQFGYMVMHEHDRNIVTNALKRAFGDQAKGFIYDEYNKIRVLPDFFDETAFSSQQLYLFQTFKRIVESNLTCAFRTREGLEGGNTVLPDGISYHTFIRNGKNKTHAIVTELGSQYNKGALYDTYGDQKSKYQKDNNITGDHVEDITLFQSITFWHELGHIVAWMKGFTWFNKTETNKQNELFEGNNKFSVGYENIFRTHLNLPLRTGRTHQTKLPGTDVKTDDIHLLQKPYR